ERRAQRLVGAVEVAQLGEDEAEVRARDAGVALIARVLERGERGDEALEAAHVIAGGERAEGARLLKPRGAERVPRGRVEGGGFDRRDQRVGRGEAAAEAQVVGALAEAVEAGAARVEGERRVAGLLGEALDAVEVAEPAGRQRDLQQRAEPRGRALL